MHPESDSKRARRSDRWRYIGYALAAGAVVVAAVAFHMMARPLLIPILWGRSEIVVDGTPLRVSPAFYVLEDTSGVGALWDRQRDGYATLDAGRDWFALRMKMCAEPSLCADVRTEQHASRHGITARCASRTHAPATSISSYCTLDNTRWSFVYTGRHAGLPKFVDEVASLARQAAGRT